MAEDQATDKQSGIAIRFLREFDITPGESWRHEINVYTDPLAGVLAELNFLLEAPPEHDSPEAAAFRQRVIAWRDAILRHQAMGRCG